MSKELCCSAENERWCNLQSKKKKKKEPRRSFPALSFATNTKKIKDPPDPRAAEVT